MLAGVRIVNRSKGSLARCSHSAATLRDKRFCQFFGFWSVTPGGHHVADPVDVLERRAYTVTLLLQNLDAANSLVAKCRNFD